jgi:hypothetical protein
MDAAGSEYGGMTVFFERGNVPYVRVPERVTFD